MTSLERIIDAQAAKRAELEDRVATLVVAEFERFDGWYSPSAVAAVTAKVAERIRSGQMSVAQLTDAYLARATSQVMNRPVSVAGVPASMGQTLRSGVEGHAEVYARIPAEFRFQQSKGVTADAALSLALTRTREMVGTDLGLAHQHQIQRFNNVRSITRYRRIIRSEKTCGLCLAASDRLYRKADLLPIHARCKCEVLAVTHKSDPGSQLNNDTLGELYGAAGSTKGADLKRVRVEVIQHGELGPQLRVLGQNVRTAA